MKAPTTIGEVASFQKSAGYIPGGLLNNVATGTAVAGIAVQEFATGGLRTTVITLTNVAITITDALAYVGTLIYTCPKGRICILGGDLNAFVLTTTSAIASTLNSGVSVSVGIGTAIASSGTLATTMQNISPGSGVAVTNLTSSTVINVAPAAVSAGSGQTVATIIDGTTTAVPIYLNLAVPTNTDIDADATVTASGTISFTWICLGDH